MKLDGRKLQKWRLRLGIKQSDLARYLCIPLRDLCNIENRRPLPRAWELREHVQDALTYFQNTPTAELHKAALQRARNTTGCLAVMQVMTRHDTTADYYVAKREQASAMVCIAASIEVARRQAVA